MPIAVFKFHVCFPIKVLCIPLFPRISVCATILFPKHRNCPYFQTHPRSPFNVQTPAIEFIIPFLISLLHVSTQFSVYLFLFTGRYISDLLSFMFTLVFCLPMSTHREEFNTDNSICVNTRDRGKHPLVKLQAYRQSPVLFLISFNSLLLSLALI
jgi:hypothetical protein